MIFYSHALYELASFDWQDLVSRRTGRTFDYTYYMDLIKKSRRYQLTEAEYYDFEICRFKYDVNQN